MMCFLLLDYLGIMTGFDEAASVPDWIWIGRLAAAALGVWLSKNWKNAVFQLLSLFTALMLARALMRWGNTLEDKKTILRMAATAVWTWGGCYSLSTALTKAQFKAFFKIFGSVWTAAMTVSAFCGLYAAWMRLRIPDFSEEGFFRLWGMAGQARLNLVSLSAVSGELMAMSIITAVICILCFEKKWIKWLFGLSILPMLTALVLTNSRTAQVCAALGAAALATVYVLDNKQKRLSASSAAHPSKRAWLSALAGGAAAFVLTLILLQLVDTAFGQLKKTSLQWAFFHAGALEGEDQMISSSREYFSDDALPGRTAIWHAVFSFLWSNKKYLLIGKSILSPMEALNSQSLTSFEAAHCHNILLQVLLESGLPGLLLLCAAVIKVGSQAVRLAGNRNAPPWQRAFPALIVVICAGELVECLTNLLFPFLPFLAVLNVAAGCVGNEEERKSGMLYQRLRRLLMAARKRFRVIQPHAVRIMKPLALIAMIVFAFIPANYGTVYGNSVLHQDDYDDPVNDLYYFCGDTQCETHRGCHTIKTSGCGLCAIVNAITYMTGEKIDVHEVAAFARENEHYAVHVGSKMSLYPAFAEEYGNKYHFRYIGRVETLEEATDYLKQGCVVIAGAGNSRGGGHLLVLANYNPVTKQYLILDSAGNYSGWSHAFYSCQTITDNHLEKNPNVFLTSFQVYYSPLTPCRDI